MVMTDQIASKFFLHLDYSTT